MKAAYGMQVGMFYFFIFDYHFRGIPEENNGRDFLGGNSETRKKH